MTQEGRIRYKQSNIKNASRSVVLTAQSLPTRVHSEFKSFPRLHFRGDFLFGNNYAEARVLPQGFSARRIYADIASHVVKDFGDHRVIFGAVFDSRA